MEGLRHVFVREITLPLIGICGPASAGKTTAAAWLVEQHGYERVRFAARLKAMVKALGLTDREIDGDLKEVPCVRLGGKTPRYAMQTIGTEWGRDLISSRLWTGMWHDDADAVIDQGGKVVVDDVRFPNEAALIKAMGGVLVRLDADSAATGGVESHPSEALNFPADITIRNRKAGLGDLHERLCAGLKIHARMAA